jgi:glycosyltransferase involved in cell wall biosynthesis
VFVVRKLNQLREKFEQPALFFSLLLVLLVTTFLLLRDIGNTNIVYPDADRILMDGVFIHDFLKDLPLTHLYQYTIEYYAQYPALSIGYRPPFFPFIEAENGDQEGFGLVMVEAMGCGCATITTALPAIKDIIDNRNTGLIIKEKSSSAILAAVSEVIENTELKDQLAINGRKHVLHNFDWQIISNDYLRLIKSILNKTVNTSKA